MKIPIVSRLTIVSSFGDLLFEKIWMWHVSTGDDKSVLVGSLMQVLSQLSRELQQSEVSYVRFTSKPTAADKTKQSTADVRPKRNMMSPLTPESKGSDTVSISPYQTGTSNHYRSKTKRGARHAPGQHKYTTDVILIEDVMDDVLGGIFLTVEDNVDFLLGNHFGKSTHAYSTVKKFLNWCLTEFNKKYGDKIRELPKVVKEKRKEGDDAAYQEFLRQSVSEFTPMIMEQYQNITNELEAHFPKDSSIAKTAPNMPSDSMRTKTGTPFQFDTVSSSDTRVNIPTATADDAEDESKPFSKSGTPRPENFV